jgi:DNA repair exonuclease SbcCD ATPase subunit
MIPRRITLAGFLCYRDEQVIDLDGSDLWVFSGRNGSGKSAVFDAMTFALFGAHRGGKQGAASLIHSEASELSVWFEFDLGPQRYRVRRSLRRGGKAERQVFRLEPDENGGPDRWPAVPETETDAGLKRWVLENIGLTYETFTASVLLMQGRAETLLGAQPRERFEILAGILDLDRFRRLHKLAEDRRQVRKAEADALRNRLRALPEVDPEAVLSAGSELAQAEAQRTAAEAEWRTLVERERSARVWDDLIRRRAEASARLDHARHLIADAEEIARAWARLHELDAVVPLLRGWIELRRRIREAQEAASRQAAGREEAHAELERLEAPLAERRAERSALEVALASDQARCAAIDARLSELAEPIAREALARHHRAEIEAIRHRLRDAPPADDDEAARKAAAVARDRRTEAALALRDAERRLAALASLDGAPACDRCGQPLTAEHLEVERGRLARQRDEAAEAHRHAEDDYRTAEVNRRAAEVLRADHERLAAARRSLDALGSRPEDATAEAQRDALRAEREALARRQDEHRKRGKALDRELSRLEAQARDLGARRDAAAAAVERSGLLVESWRAEAERQRAAAPEAWRSRFDEADEAELAALDREREDFRAAGIERAATELPRAQLMLAQAQSQVGEIDRQVAAIPEDARIDPQHAAAATAAAAEALTRLDDHRRAAQAKLDALRRDVESRQVLEAQAKQAEREHAIAETLARLLGRDGLQRELLREAERGVLDAANPILRELSGGELELRLRGDDGGDPEQALPLEALVRTHGRTRVHDVAYLSGSQRFRVAVSLALGIGRYARGLHRPIESVIIDEGFGCLDRQGRDEMIGELNALKGRLARVVLVSHQDEFAEAFRDGYHFEIVEGTTVARAFHR